MTDTQLATTEHERLTVLEITIRDGLNTFLAVGSALIEINDQRLYRAEFPTFEAYCSERWGLKRQRAYELMGAADIANRVSEISDIAPERESHVAPLAALPEAEQPAAWAEAVETAPEGKVTAKHVENVVARRVTPKAEPEVQVDPEPATPRSRAKGIELAHEAINALKMIPVNDPCRRDGFKIVGKFVADNAPEPKARGDFDGTCKLMEALQTIQSLLIDVADLTPQKSRQYKCVETAFAIRKTINAMLMRINIMPDSDKRVVDGMAKLGRLIFSEPINKLTYQSDLRQAWNELRPDIAYAINVTIRERTPKDNE